MVTNKLRQVTTAGDGCCRPRLALHGAKQDPRQTGSKADCQLVSQCSPLRCCAFDDKITLRRSLEGIGSSHHHAVCTAAIALGQYRRQSTSFVRGSAGSGDVASNDGARTLHTCARSADNSLCCDTGQGSKVVDVCHCRSPSKISMPQCRDTSSV